MDATGGAPYVFDDNRKGFEVELAAFLGCRGLVHVVFLVHRALSE